MPFLSNQEHNRSANNSRTTVYHKLPTEDYNINRSPGQKDTGKDKSSSSPSPYLDQERQAIAERLDQYNQVSDTASMNSITTTNDSFNWMGSPDLQQQQQQQQQSYDDGNYSNGYHRDDDINYGSPHGTSSKMSSHLLSSNSRDPEDRGNLNLAYNRDSGNMDYMQEDPYSGHRLPPHHDPYYSGGGGGGSNYGGNTSFEPPHSEQSYHSDYNRQPPTNSYSELPNGRGPHGYHPSEHNNSLHHQQQSPRDDSYAGSYQGEPPQHNSGNYMDPYPTTASDHQGYPDGIYSHGGGHPSSNYSFHGDPQQVAAENPIYNDGGGGGGGHNDDQFPRPEDYREIHNQSSGAVDVPYLQDDYNQYPQHPHHQQPNGSFNESYNQAPPPPQQQQGGYDPYAEEDRYSGQHSLDHSRGNYSQQDMSPSHPPPPPSHQQHHPHHPNESFHNDNDDDPRNQGQYNGLPPVHQDPFANDPFHNQQQGGLHPDGSESGRGPYDYRGPSPDVGGGQPYNDQGSQQQYDDRGPPYDDRGPPYDDRGPPYDDRGPPYDDRGPPYDDRGPPYDDRGGGSPYNYHPGDMPDAYGGHPQNQGYPEDYPENGSNYGSTQPRGENPYYPSQEQEVLQRMDQMNLNAPPPMDGRMTPADDGGVPNYFDASPDLQQVIDLMSSPDDNVVSSAVAYLQHLTYMDDSVKAKTRALGGIPLLISLLSHDKVSIHKNACGALQNLSYGRSNNDNKRTIKNENGIPELIRLMRKTTHEDVLESVTGVLWNLSSCEDLKLAIIEDGLSVLMNVAIAKYGAFVISSDSILQATCRNATGIVRNVSSAGFEARKQLRECKGLVNTLMNILRVAAIRDHDSLDSKPIENTVCILRNLSYRIQEVVEPDFYKKRSLPAENQAGSKKGSRGEVGCFGNKGKAKQTKKSNTKVTNVAPPVLPPLSIEYRALWGGELHNFYSIVFRTCTNPITLEAAAGAIQNLTACDWQPAVDSRMMIRKEKGLPLMVDLLSAESDRVLCATATALRNLSIDEKNKELIGKYSIRQLAIRLPKDNRSNMPDDTICAIVATLYEVVKDNQDFAMALIEDGLLSLVHINSSDRRYLARTLKFTSTLLKTMWSYKALHSEYAAHKCYQADFISSKATPRQEGSRPPVMSPSSHNTSTMGSHSQGQGHHGGGAGNTGTLPPPNYSTLSRPISSQGISAQGYDDNTLSTQRMNAMRFQDIPPEQPSPYSSRHDPQLQNPHGSFYGTANPRMTPTPSDRFRGDLNRSNASIHDQRDDGNYSRGRGPPEEIHMNDFGAGYAPLDEPQPHRTKPPVGGVPLFPALSPGESSSPYPGDGYSGGNEPLYAQVNKGSRRRLDHYGPDGGSSPRMANLSSDAGGEAGGVDSWV